MTDVLPEIDISPLNGQDRSKWKAVADRMGAAAREVGFFYVVGHGVSAEKIEAAYSAAEEFFALPDEVKRSYYIGDSLNHRGYVPFTEKGDYADEKSRNYEAFDLALDLPHDDPDYLAGNLLLGPNVWPSLKGFRERIGAYYASISDIGLKICASLELHLELEPGELTQQMTKPISQLRLLHYVRSAEAVETTSVNMGAHTDYECLTLLHQRQKGLQVMTKGDEWVDVPVKPHAYVINIGDMMEAWTNGVFRSTPHRVLNLSPERFSMPYFVAANYDTVIQPFPSLISPNNPPKYEGFTAGLHLERMLLRDFPYLRERRGERIWSAKHDEHGPVLNPFESRMNKVGSK
ncbi:MAG: 2-oxoglutarate and iron-dependent oxygenase domain-containing protein [Pseudomonadota bacterium]